MDEIGTDEVDVIVPDWLYMSEEESMDMKPPAVNPDYTEMEELAVPDWLYMKIRNRETEDRNLRKRNWTTEDKKFRKRNWLMEVEPDEESVLSEEESRFTLLPQYRSWSTASYVRRAYQ